MCIHFLAEKLDYKRRLIFIKSGLHILNLNERYYDKISAMKMCKNLSRFEYSIEFKGKILKFKVSLSNFLKLNSNNKEEMTMKYILSTPNLSNERQRQFDKLVI